MLSKCSTGHKYDNGEIQLVDMGTIKIRVEDELLLCCARTNVNPEIMDKILSLVQNDMNWDYLLKMASGHRLMPLLYYNLNSICPKMVPEDILNKLKDNFNANVRKNLMLTGELIKVLNLLESEGITAVPYKGPVLAASTYGNVGLREFNDLDIFIKKQDTFKIIEILLSEGYIPKFRLNKNNEEAYLKSQKGFILKNDTYEFSIDFQWKFSGNFFSFPSIPESLLDDPLGKVIINGHEISVFSPENILLILSIHAAGHHWSRLAWLCDIAELIKNYDLNWDEIIKKANLMGIKRILNVNLNLVNRMLGIDIPEKISHNIISDVQTKKISEEVQKNLFSEKLKLPYLWNWAYFHLQIRENLKNGINDSIQHAIVPSIEELKALELPNHLYPFYYVFKPFNLLKRYG